MIGPAFQSVECIQVQLYNLSGVEHRSDAACILRYEQGFWDITVYGP